MQNINALCKLFSLNFFGTDGWIWHEPRNLDKWFGEYF